MSKIKSVISKIFKIYIALMVVFFLFNIFFPGEESSSLEATQAEQYTGKDFPISECDFVFSWVNDEVPVTPDHASAICEITGNYYKHSVAETRALLRSQCPLVFKTVANLGGKRRAWQLINAGEMDRDPVAKQIFIYCLDEKDERSTMLDMYLKSRIDNSAIYSVGSITIDGEQCVAGIMKNNGVDGSEMFYLVGSDACERVYIHDADSNPYHPESNPSGVKPGNWISEKYQYDGLLPESFSYKGTVYSFREK